MFRLDDFILLLVIFSSMLAGIFLPRPASIFQPYPVYLMMFLLFLSFLSIKIEAVWGTVRNNLKTVIWLSFLKLILFPLCIYFLFRVFFPSYAIAALLLTGMSTGVVAPFISTLVSANVNLVLVMVVISSPLVPFTLPALVKILLGRSIEISLLSMMRILCMVIFVPILAVEILRRITPRMLDSIMKRRYPISLVIFAVINLGVFSKYSDFFYQNPLTILEAAFVAILLGGIYLVVGISALWKGPTEDQIGSAISLGNMNNVLVLVFASEFFTPLEPTVAAMYMIPFFGLIFPLRVYQRLRKNHSPG
jgi:BASS family bile acid:Na+ symporter